MKIGTAELSDCKTVLHIVRETVSAVYPHYYPEGAVRFFLAHHKEERIRQDIAAGAVYLLFEDSGIPVGTVTVRGNEINRLFVLPEQQGNGFGRVLMDFAEALIGKAFSSIELDSSLPAKAIYLRRGYETVSYHVIDADGDYLCYDHMKKEVKM